MGQNTANYNEVIFTNSSSYIFTVQGPDLNSCKIEETLKNIGYRKTTDIYIDRNKDNPFNAIDFYILPLSRDMLENYEKKYKRLYLDIETIFNNPESYTKVIPINTQEMCAREWDEMRVKLENTNLRHTQMLDITRTDHIKSSTPFEDLLSEALNFGEMNTDNNKERKIFPFNIFISYRQKDRLLACAMMRSIHKNKEFKDIGFWYDQNLVGGINFEQQIRSELREADLVLMLVTDNLMVQGNYVATHEYKMMCNMGKRVIPIAFRGSLYNNKDLAIINTDENDNAITFFTQEEADFYRMYPEAETVDKLIYTPEDLNRSIAKYKQEKQKSKGYPKQTYKQLYEMALAYEKGIRTERNMKEAEKLLSTLVETGNRIYKDKANLELVRIYKERALSSDNNEKDYEAYINQLHAYYRPWLKELKSSECAESRNKWFKMDIETPCLYSESDDRYAIPDSKQELEDLCNSILLQIEAVEKCMDYHDTLSTLSKEQKIPESCKANVNALPDINSKTESTIHGLLTVLYLLRNPEDEPNLTRKTIISEDRGGQKEKANTFKLTYKNIEENCFGHETTTLSTLWVLVKELQYRHLMANMDNVLSAEEKKYYEDDIICVSKKLEKKEEEKDVTLPILKNAESLNGRGFKAFNILTMLQSFLNDRRAKDSEEPTEDNIELNKRTMSDKFDNVRKLLNLKKSETDPLNELYTSVIDYHLSRISRINLLHRNTAEDESKLPFWSKTAENSITEGIDAYRTICSFNNRGSKTNDTLMRESEHMQNYLKALSLTAPNLPIHLDELMKLENPGWQAYRALAKDRNGYNHSEKYLSVLEDCFKILKKNDTASLDRNETTSEFMDNCKNHISQFTFISNNDDLRKMKNILEDNLEGIQDTYYIRELNAAIDPSNDKNSNMKWVAAERKYLELTKSRSAMLDDNNTLMTAIAACRMLDPENEDKKSSINQDKTQQSGFINKYDAFKKLRYCISTLLSVRQDLIRQIEIINKTCREFIPINKKWSIYVEKCQALRYDMDKLSAKLKKQTDITIAINLLRKFMTENSLNFEEGYWDPNDAETLISYLYSLMPKNFISPEISELYDILITRYCQFYIVNNYANKIKFIDYLDRMFDNLKTGINNQEQLEDNLSNIKETYNLLSCLFRTGTCLEYIESRTVNRLKYDLYHMYRQFNTALNNEIYWPIENDPDFSLLEEVYQFDQCANAIERNEASKIRSIYYNKFCTEGIKAYILNNLTNPTLPLTKHYMELFCEFEDHLLSECTMTYNTLKKQQFDRSHIINNSGKISSLKRTLISDFWEDECKSTSYRISDSSASLMNIYPDTMMEVIWQSLKKVLNDLKDINHREKHVIFGKPAENLSDFINSIVFHMNHLVYIDSILPQNTANNKNIADWLSLAYTQVKPYFALLHPVNMRFWSEFCGRYENDDIAKKYNEWTKNIILNYRTWYLLETKLFETIEHDIRQFKFREVKLKDKDLVYNIKLNLSIINTLKRIIEMDPQIKKISPKVEEKEEEEKEQKQYVIEDDVDDVTAYNEMIKLNNYIIVSNFYFKWIPIIEGTNPSALDGTCYDNYIGNDIGKMMEDTIIASIFTKVWKKSGLLVVPYTSLQNADDVIKDQNDYERIKEQLNQYRSVLEKLKKINLFRYHVFNDINIHDYSEVEKIYNEKKNQKLDVDLETIDSVYPDPAKIGILLSHIEKTLKKLQEWEKANSYKTDTHQGLQQVANQNPSYPPMQQGTNPNLYNPQMQQGPNTNLYNPPMQQGPNPNLYNPQMRQGANPNLYNPQMQQGPNPNLYNPQMMQVANPSPTFQSGICGQNTDEDDKSSCHN